MKYSRQVARRFRIVCLVGCVLSLLLGGGCRSKARTDTGEGDTAKKQQEMQKEMMQKMMKGKGGPSKGQ